jgi:hypothetical protein
MQPCIYVCANELLGSCCSLIFINLGQYLIGYPLIFVHAACCAGLYVAPHMAAWADSIAGSPSLLLGTRRF